MKAKLTLSINKETIEKAKLLSAKTGRSISAMFEQYLADLTNNQNKTSAVKRISGLLKGKVPQDVNWKDVKAAYIKDKYGV